MEAEICPQVAHGPYARAMSTIRKAGDLVAAGLAPLERLPELERVAARYAVAITPAVAELIDPADPHDPIARQFVPTGEELESGPLERADPIGDFAHSPVEGIVHRYRDRVLLKPTHTCAVYCRFCFRREMVGPEGLSNLTPGQLDAAFAYIAARPQIWEVIVTGGDPLVLSPRRLAELSARLARIEHVKVVRYHTRIPAVDPAAVTDELIEALRRLPEMPRTFITPASCSSRSGVALIGVEAMSRSKFPCASACRQRRHPRSKRQRQSGHRQSARTN